VISVWETFSCEEEVLSSFLVEFSFSSWAEWHMGNVEVTVGGIFDPVREFVSLNV